MPNEVVVLLVAAGIPACLLRLWWMWWQSTCIACGLAHSACVCPSGDHTMRPRR
jgi:hypothetical protein